MDVLDKVKIFNNKMASDSQILCPYCLPGKTLDSYEEYKDPEGKLTNMQFMKREENTFCPWTGCFTCTECFVRIGTPLLEDLSDAYLMFRLKAEGLPHQDTVLLAEKMVL